MPAGRLVGPLREAFRGIVSTFRGDPIVTPQQDLILRNVGPSRRAAIEAVLREHGIALAAHRAGALVHVEDVPALSGLHAPAAVRRGDLVITVSTNGRSPGLASRVRRWIEVRFGDEWASAVEDLSCNRRIWPAPGLR